MTKTGDSGVMPMRCLATNQAGTPCSARPLPSGWCRWHDPSLAADRAAWSRKGGEARSNRRRALAKLPGELLSLRDVQAMLCLSLKAVIAGRLEPGVGNAAATLGRAIAAIATAGDLEERVAELERSAGVDAKWRA